MIKFTKKITVNSNRNKIWEVFAHDFNNAYNWMASVPKSYHQSIGNMFEGAKTDGRVCELTSKPDGMKAIEQFLAYDEVNQTATVKIDFDNTPTVFPVKYNTLEFSMKEISEDQTEMTWKFSSRIKPLAYIMYPVIRNQFSTFVFEIMEELKFYVENGTPHPRKVKAIEKQKSRQK
tara:strand:+ start:593 stop:1120 length:528 start_codon:yes stop_codon:yes gene_type:complete